VNDFRLMKHTRHAHGIAEIEAASGEKCFKLCVLGEKGGKVGKPRNLVKLSGD
jgi:hypothetical protein